jgi:hypothetical protein
MTTESDPNGRDNEQDFIWRFPLRADACTAADSDPLVEMMRAFLADLLDIGWFTREGRRVQVDGFALANDPERVFKIFPSQLNSSLSTDEPNLNGGDAHGDRSQDQE